MPSYFPPKKNTAYVFYASLVSQANTKITQVNPTLASGDFQVSGDGAALANLATLPTVTPAAGAMVKFSLSASEMNFDNVTVVCIDAAGAEWCAATFNIQTAARQLDDLAYPATSGRSMVVDANGLVDANAVKVGPTGSGTAQTAGDLKGTLGTPAGASLAADLAEIEAETDTILTNTTGITFTVANQVDVNVVDWKGAAAPAMTGDAYARLGAPAGASVSADVAAIKAETVEIDAATDLIGTPAGASLAADIAAVKSDTGGIASLPTNASVKTQVVAALNSDTYAEPGQGAPASTTTLAAKIGYLYKFAINKLTQTANTENVYDATGATVDQKATVSDVSGTTTRGAIGSGP